MSENFSLPVKITVASVPESYQPPTDMQGLLEAIPQFTTYEMADQGATVNISSDGAGADGNGLFIWMLNAYKLPPRILTGYRNDWWTVYNGVPGEIRMLIADWGSYFDASGRGHHWGLWEGWALCNGQNGTVQLANEFIIPGYRWDGGGWVTDVYTYSQYNSQAASTSWWDQINIDSYGISGADRRRFNLSLVNFGNFGGEPGAATLEINYNNQFTSINYSGGAWTVVDSGRGNTKFNYAYWTYPLDQSPYMVNSPVSRIPPYIAVGYAQFVGYP
jgi:hypothetical protein